MSNSENLWKILTDINEAIKFAEAKGIAIIGSSGILTAFLFSKQDSSKHFEFTFYTFLFLLCIIVLFISLLFALFCVKPNFKNKSKDSVFYFKSILETFENEESYNKYLDRINHSDFSFDKQIVEQIFVKSKIANRKFEHINMSIYFFIAFLFLLLLLMFLN